MKCRSCNEEHNNIGFHCCEKCQALIDAFWEKYCGVVVNSGSGARCMNPKLFGRACVEHISFTLEEVRRVASHGEQPRPDVDQIIEWALR